MTERLALFGGPLHRLGCRSGLIRGRTNSTALGLTIGLGLWTVLLMLALVEGGQDRVFSLAAIGGHVRLLAVVPLFFVCEALLADRPAHFIRTIVDSQVVAQRDVPTLEAEVARANRLGASWKAEAVCLLLAVLSPLLAQQASLPGTTASSYQYRLGVEGTISLSGLWYWTVCMTVFRFLLLRWAWRLALWTHLLWRVSRLSLELTPTHPDGAGGIGYLEVVHTQFAPLAMGISAVFAAASAEAIAVGTGTFDSIYLSLLLLLVADLMLFVGPLAMFATRLYACREKGIVDYTVYMTRYLKHFEREWVRPDVDPAAAPLAAADVQSLADLANVVNGVRRTSLIPAGMPLLATLAIAASLPFLPLALLKYPIADLAARLVGMLFGLP